MLVNGFTRENGIAVDHLLASVEAIFVDEAHLFDCSARGDQVLFLIERLRQLRITAAKRGWTTKTEIQICGASATVSGAQELAERILGRGSLVLQISGARKLSILSHMHEWLTVDATTKPTELIKEITTGATSKEVISKLVKIFREQRLKKVLIFCPSRAMCDETGEALKSELKNYVQAWIGTHHGSLDGKQRRMAEKCFAECSGVAVLVATSTLEVGVDIGDVDVVALVGPPPDVPSLLQRIGRGGRRSGGTQVLPLAENYEHAAALAGMLVSAANGNFSCGKRFRNWGVFVQQCASYILQNGSKGRSQNNLLDLAHAVWPEDDTRVIAEKIINDLKEQGSLFESRSRLYLQGSIVDKIDKKPTSAHSNIRDGGMVIPVRNNQNGEIIGHVAGSFEGNIANIGGRRVRVVSNLKNEILVTNADKAGAGAEKTIGAKYPTVPFLISRRYCLEVAKGVGLTHLQAPIVDDIWWHFGGQALEKMLCIMRPDIFVEVVSKGMALRVINMLSPLKLFPPEEDIIKELSRVVARSRSRYSRSSYDDFLSDHIFSQTITESLQPSDIAEFLYSREILDFEKISPLREKLRLLLS
jgi:Lhr-like helicase